MARVLVVESDAMFQAWISGILASAGHRAIVYQPGEQTSEAPDAAIVSAAMLSRRRVKELQALLPVSRMVVLKSSRSSIDAEERLGRGVSTLIRETERPFRPRELFAALPADIAPTRRLRLVSGASRSTELRANP